MRYLLTIVLSTLVGSVTVAQRNCPVADISLPIMESNFFREKEFDHDKVILIPVVVHIVYSNESQNLSDEQVKSQIQVLNDDFRRTNKDAINTLPEFEKIAADTRINFFLTNIDEVGILSVGITRTFTTHGPFADDDIKFTERGGANAWDTRRFINIWVCDLADGVFGFGTPPGSGVDVDGVVVDYKYFGTKGNVQQPFHLGRTTTHEVGHYFGLSHLWGSSGDCLDDDGVEDTPLQAGPSPGCQTAKMSCGSLDMVQNFMDQSDDACMNLFTEGQKWLMRKNIAEFRNDLVYQLITEIDQYKLEIKPIELIRMEKNLYKITSIQTIETIHAYDLIGKSFLNIEKRGTNKFYLPSDINSPLIIVIVDDNGKSHSFRLVL